jgi:transcriptional regulator of acetoin/glycerol metabolism
LLVETFLRRMRVKTGKNVEVVNDEVMRLLMEHDWPGNVRELQSAIEFAAIRCRSRVIRPEELPPELRTPARERSGTGDPRVEERHRLIAALRAARGNRTAAARLMGISRATFYRRLSELAIELD